MTIDRMEARSRRKEERAACDKALAGAFARGEEECAERARAARHAVEAVIRRRDASADEDLRQMREEAERWRASCVRARVQTLRCIDALARRRGAEMTRRTFRAWREEIKEQRAREKIETEERLVRMRAVVRAWRAVIVERLDFERRCVGAALTREAEYYGSQCEAAVAKLAVDRKQRRNRCENKRVDTMESSMREAFMRGVCALNLDALRGEA